MFGSGGGPSIAEVGPGAVVFLPLMAIFSVVLAATTMSYAARGIVLADRDMAPGTLSKRSAYQALLIIAIIFNAIFIPAIMNYRWLDWSVGYDSFYHVFGYFGNIVLVIVAGAFASRDKVSAPSIFFLSYAIAIAYLLFAFSISSATSGSGDSNPGQATIVAFSLGYALLQFAIPAIYYSYVKRNADRLAERRLTKMMARSGQVVRIIQTQPIDTSQSGQPITTTLADGRVVTLTPVDSSEESSHENPPNGN
jgi:hypothetical protein